MKSNRLGLAMIAASLAVIALIAVGLWEFQGRDRDHERQIRKQGISLSR